MNYKAKCEKLDELVKLLKREPLQSPRRDWDIWLNEIKQLESEIAEIEPEDERKRAEEILQDNMSDTLLIFINTYPVSYGADKMLKDWIIDAMLEFRGEMPGKDKCNHNFIYSEIEGYSYCNKCGKPM
jgi:hypothetical protein